VARLAQRDPEHVAERIALYAADRRAESARTGRSMRQRAGLAVLTAVLVLLVGFFAFPSQRTQTMFGVNWVGLAAVLVVAGIAIAARRPR
jgi:hypothetical protein